MLPLLLLLSVAPINHAGQVYKWVDAQGKTHYTQTPPPDTNTKAEKLKTRTHNKPGTQPDAATGEGSAGTGWPIYDGLVVTNNHVVGNYPNIHVVLTSGLSLKAEVVQRDKQNDIVLLKVADSNQLPPALPVANKSARMGDKVFTIGYPHTDIMGSKPKLTSGIISALSGLGDDARTYQISVDLQAGNSGGPLINMRGEVVGIVTAKLNAVKIFNWTGDLPQGVNYAVKVHYLDALRQQNPAGHQPIPRLYALEHDAELAELADKIQNSVLHVIAQQNDIKH